MDINDITAGGIAHLSPPTTRYDTKFYIIKLVIKLHIWSQFCELAMDTDVSKTSRVLEMFNLTFNLKIKLGT